jgi:hypothetical protein
MIRFFQGIKRAADFFSIHPDGLSFVTERRLKDLEASVSRLPKAISDRNFTSIMNLEYDIYELKETIKTLQSTLDKEQVTAQLVLPAERTKTIKKPKPVKLQAIEEEVKKVKSLLTQAEVKRLLEYRDGELYWKVDRGYKVKKGDKAGSIVTISKSRKVYHVTVNSHNYSAGRLVFLMFHGYLPEYVSFVDGDGTNVKIENLRAVTRSQLTTFAKITKSNSSGYKGAFLDKRTGKYVAQIVKNKKFYYLGTFDTPQEAYKAYCKAAKKLHGEFARVA